MELKERLILNRDGENGREMRTGEAGWRAWANFATRTLVIMAVLAIGTWRNELFQRSMRAFGDLSESSKLEISEEWWWGNVSSSLLPDLRR
jgi:hypothetical protein